MMFGIVLLLVGFVVFENWRLICCRCHPPALAIRTSALPHSRTMS
jgi:hypothetical protein